MREHRRIGTALEILARGILTFFERELIAVYGDKWLVRVIAVSLPARLMTFRGDAHFLLNVMWEQWNPVLGLAQN